MPLTVLTRSSLASPARGDAARWSAPGRILIGLVNNMPDSALEATAAQFSRLLRAAAGPLQVELMFCYLPEVQRAPEVREQVSRAQWHVEEVFAGSLDALIVTGMEPKVPRLVDEPYWRRFEQLLEWAETHTVSSIWSCLAAHAAVQSLDSIERRRLEHKRFGVFWHEVASGHNLVHGVRAPFPTPHSRWNDLPLPALRAAGYRIITWSPEGGADLFVKQGRSLLVFLQGHPEYDQTTLLREYRRDVGRFVRGLQPHYPDLPCGYLSADAAAVLADFRRRALAAPSEELLASFPMDSVSSGLQNTWGAGAVGIYRNWLSWIAAAKRSGPRLASVEL